MSQALYTSMGGINAATTAISVVSNNVANINTTAFKAADTRFENLFSKTYTTGNSPTKTTGGVNPMQVGMGVQVGSIVRNFTEGSYVATGRTDDLMISGGGYFTVMDAHGEIYLTRDGAFTLDSEGNMVNQSGFYVLGAEQLYNTSGSQSKINVPQSIKTEAVGNAEMGATLVKDLNDAAITPGTFKVKFNDGTGSKQVEVKITQADLEGNMDALISTIDNQLKAMTTTQGGVTYQNVVPSIVTEGDNVGTIQFKCQPTYDKENAIKEVITVKNDDNTFKDINCYKFTVGGNDYYWNGVNNTPIYAKDGLDLNYVACKTAGDEVVKVTDFVAGGTNGVEVTIKTISGDIATPKAAAATDFANLENDHKTDKVYPTIEFSAGTSNFLEATRLASSEQDKTTGTYTSKVLDYTVTVEPVAALSEAVNLKSYSVANDGTIEATYSNGDKITVEANKQDNTFQFKYTTATGVVIRGTEHVKINENIAKPENLVLQMATVTNEAGLVSLNNNLWSVGPNTGEMVFAVGGSMGMGEIQNGGLEGSNVDLSRELSNMILAQRAIQANSRVFSTASSVMESLAYLGQ